MFVLEYVIVVVVVVIVIVVAIVYLADVYSGPTYNHHGQIAIFIINIATNKINYMH